MSTIVPRWEWRTFASRTGGAERRLADLAVEPPSESDERYLLSPSDANVKVRDAHVDVKALEVVGAQGLERWRPTAHLAFPLSAGDVVEVSDALGTSDAALDRDAPTADDLIAALAEDGQGGVRAVAVHKRRLRCRVAGCMAEVCDVEVDGHARRTIAIESEDEVAVTAAIREVGLEGYVNVNYPRGLRSIVDDEPERFAVIDVGTNSVKFHLAEPSEDGAWRTVDDRAEVTRLGEGLAEAGTISDTALDRTAEAIAGMTEEARGAGAVAIVAVGTAGLRAARNADTAIQEIRRRTGVTVEVIPPEEEARLAYLAATAELDLPEAASVVFDTGGGSTQFTFGHGSAVDDRFSVPVGAARFTERFGLDGEASRERVDEALRAIAEELGTIREREEPEALIGMGGALTNMAAVAHELAAYDPTVVHGTVLDRAEVERQIEEYRTLDAESRRSIVGLQPSRAEVILAGACIVLTVLELLRRGSLTVSDRGLRHGLLRDRFGDG
jgi:exopolyphosphatase / guanosine-5'-triphosphate,3'-diphosphate pyrophosphatase